MRWKPAELCTSRARRRPRGGSSLLFLPRLRLFFRAAGDCGFLEGLLERGMVRCALGPRARNVELRWAPFSVAIRERARDAALAMRGADGKQAEAVGRLNSRCCHRVRFVIDGDPVWHRSPGEMKPLRFMARAGRVKSKSRSQGGLEASLDGGRLRSSVTLRLGIADPETSRRGCRAGGASRLDVQVADDREARRGEEFAAIPRRTRTPVGVRLRTHWSGGERQAIGLVWRENCGRAVCCDLRDGVSL